MRKLKVINEVLGVPSGLVVSAKEIYNKFINQVSDDYTFDTLNGNDFVVSGRFIIGDYLFNKALIRIKLDEGSNVSLNSFGNEEYIRVGGDLTKTRKADLRVTEGFGFILNINMTAPRNVTGKNIREYLQKNNQKLVVASFAHELKHRYDGYKRSVGKLTDRADYLAHSKLISFGVGPLNEFFYYLYFIDFIENLVRTSQVATEMDVMGISKRNFLKFMMSNETVIELKKINNFTYEGLKQDLMAFADGIRQLAKDTKLLGYEGTDEQVIENLLEYAFKRSKLFKMNVLAQHISDPNELEEFKKTKQFPDKLRNEVIKDYMSQIDRKYKGDYNNFFQLAEQEFKVISNKVLRKIYKLYALAGDIKDRKYPQSFDRMVSRKYPKPLSMMMKKKNVSEEYYESRKSVEGYVDSNDLVGQRLWFHTNRTHKRNNWNGMIGIYDTTRGGIKTGNAGRYTNEVRLKSPIYFQTSESGAERIQSTGDRQLIAGVSGIVVPTNNDTSGMVKITYNPFDLGYFHLIDDKLKRQVISGDEVYFNATENGDWDIWVRNPKFV
jgi:hypothetical protein